MYRQVVKLKK